MHRVAASGASDVIPADMQPVMEPACGSLRSSDPTEFTPAATRTFIASIVTQLFGGTNAIGLFPLLMLPISHSLGWSRAEMGSMAGVTGLMAAMGMPVWGALVDRYGARRIVLIATAFTGLSFWALALQSGSLATGYACFAAIGFASGVSVAQIKAQAVLFVRNRGFVLAVLGIVIGLCFSLTPLAAQPVLSRYDWRTVYAVFGCLPILVSLPLLLAWFRVPRAVVDGSRGPRATTLKEALRSPNFWLIVMLAVSSGLVFAGMQVHLVAFLEDRGMSSHRAVIVLSAAAFGSAFCQVLTGRLLDRLRTPRAAIPFVGIALAGMLLLQSSQGGTATIAGAIALQSGVGGELSLTPYLISCAFGTVSLARIFGTAALLAQAVSGISPVMLGVIRERTGSYADALPAFTILLCCSIGLIRKRLAETVASSWMWRCLFEKLADRRWQGVDPELQCSVVLAAEACVIALF